MKCGKVLPANKSLECVCAPQKKYTLFLLPYFGKTSDKFRLEKITLFSSFSPLLNSYILASDKSLFLFLSQNFYCDGFTYISLR